MVRFLKKQKVEARPTLDDVDLELAKIPEAVVIVDGFPRIDWSKVQTAVKPYAEHPQINQIWIELAWQWLAILRGHLGNQYQRFETKYLLVLSAQSPGEARGVADIGDKAYERLEQLLQRPPESRGHGKHVVLVMKTRRHYYDYVAHFYPERDEPYGLSAGIHVSQGYRHTVVNGATAKLKTLVHELAHDMVSHLPLPRWLNEGMAQFMQEDLIRDEHRGLLNQRQARLHRRYWTWFGLDAFWRGDSFHKRSSRALSYQLAFILFHNLANDCRRNWQLTKFLQTARRNDGGEAACQACFGCSLENLAGQFLGRSE